MKTRERPECRVSTGNGSDVPFVVYVDGAGVKVEVGVGKYFSFSFLGVT